MKKFLTSFIIVLSFARCTNNYIYLDINPELETFVNEFIFYSHVYNKKVFDLKLDFDLFEPNFLGYAMVIDGLRNVSVNTNRGCTLDDDTLRMVIFHELGHAFLGRKHLDGYDKNHDQLSIMNKSTCCLTCKEMVKRKTKEYYVKELFTVK